MSTSWLIAICINVLGNFISATGWMLQKKQHIRTMSESANSSKKQQAFNLPEDVPDSCNVSLSETESTNLTITATASNNEDMDIGPSSATASTADIQTSSASKSSIQDTNLKYVVSWRWWLGFIMYGGGSAVAAVSYTYGPNSLLLPLETCILAFTTLLGWKCLNERIFTKDFIGIFCIFVGVVLSVFVAPKQEQEDEYTVKQLVELYTQSSFWMFIVCYTSMTILGYITFAIPRLNEYVQSTENDNYFLMIFVNLSAYFGAWNLVFLKSMLEIISSTINGNGVENWTHALSYLVVLGFILTILIMEYWRQKALALFVSTYVLAFYRVFVTTAGVLFGAFYWNDFQSVRKWEIALYSFATFITFVGVGFIAMKQDAIVLQKVCRRSKRTKATDVKHDRLVDLEMEELDSI